MLIGLLIGGYLSDKYGRRFVCISGTSFNVIVSLIMVFPKSFIAFIAYRIFTGFGTGIMKTYLYIIACITDVLKEFQERLRFPAKSWHNF